MDAPGTYVLVDHSLSRAFNKGAIGMLKATGPVDRVLYSGKELDAVYVGTSSAEGSASAKREIELKAKIAAEIKSNPAIASLTKEVQLERGKQVYMSSCFACHLPDGKGMANVFPPLAGSDYLKADRDRAIRVVLKGLTGPVTVNGVNYNSAMPPQPLTDEQVADVMTYVTNSWGNQAPATTVDDVRRVKNETH
jgi:nitrite reductase (NO-forming)